MFGIKEGKVRERLLCESNPTLLKTDEICLAAESKMVQTKVLGDNSELIMSDVKSDQEQQKSYADKAKSLSDRKISGNVGTVVINTNTTRKTYACPALGEICSKCSKAKAFCI